MKILNLFNGALLALAASFTLTLGVVCILYAFYLDAAPRMRSEWYVVLKLTLVFVLMTAVAAWAFWSQWHQRRDRWFAEAALVLVLVAGGTWVAEVLG